MPPLTLMIKPVSSMCNMRCKYCFYADVSRHREVQSFGSNVPHTYTVMAGDTLWDIARRTLGDGASYGAIFDANYDAIVKSGGIRPGMTITIPEVG